MKNEKWFALSADAVEKKLKTNAASGLSRKAARSRANKNAGSVFLIPQASPWRLLGELLSDFALILLLLASFLSMFFEDTPMGAVVFVLLLLHLAASFVIYFYSRRTMEGIQGYFYPKAKVIRNGKLFSVDGRNVVPGDVILLEPGDVLCADARLIHSDRLRVNMRLDAEQYTELEKYAEGFVHPGEYRPWEMSNMVHAGSVVLEGSARAIATAVGQYTYLGARTGGIRLPEFKKFPPRLEALLRHCTKWNVLLLLTVLPLCIVSLLIGHFNGGTVLLSGAFLTYMCLIATGTTQLTCMLGIFFYVRKIRVLLRAPDPAVIRSVDAMDRLGRIDYLFLRDGAFLTDGIWHFSSAYSAEGELKPQHGKRASAQLFCEFISLYHAAITETVATGLTDSARYSIGMDEFLNQYKVDRTALRIRYGIQSYLPGKLETDGDKVCLSDRGRRFFLTLTSSQEAISCCKTAIKGGSKHSWNEEEKQKLHSVYDRLTASHQIPLIIMISADGTNQDACFVGLMAFKEGIDEHRVHHIRALERTGCRVISFLSSDRSPAIPQWAVTGTGASKQEFLSRGLPITYRLGMFEWYRDLDDADIALLMDALHNEKKQIAIASFGVLPESLLSRADLVLSAASIPKGNGSVKEMMSMELSGNADSLSCMQNVREGADILLPRPSRKHGGLASFAVAKREVLHMNAGWSAFLRYLFGMQLARMIVAILPLLTGKPFIDARHLIFCSGVLDLFAFFAFAFGVPPIQSRKRHSDEITEWKKYFYSERSWILAAIISALSILIMPWLLALPGVFGTYLYRTEFVFTALILLHITALAVMRLSSAHRLRLHAGLYWVLGACLAAGALLLTCYTSDMVGEWFAVEKNPLPYLILSILPSVFYVAVWLLGKAREKNKKS